MDEHAAAAAAAAVVVASPPRSEKFAQNSATFACTLDPVARPRTRVI